MPVTGAKFRGAAAAAALAASALAAAAALAPAVANATPAAPLPAQGLGGSLGEALAIDCLVNPADCLPIGQTPTQNAAFWFGPANPNFQPLVGIVFPNIFGFKFEFCVLGGAVHLSPYGSGFIGLGAGC